MHNAGELWYDYVSMPNIQFQQLVQERTQNIQKQVNTGAIV